LRRRAEGRREFLAALGAPDISRSPHPVRLPTTTSALEDRVFPRRQGTVLLTLPQRSASRSEGWTGHRRQLAGFKPREEIEETDGLPRLIPP
jgi:hypothetical protein